MGILSNEASAGGGNYQINNSLRLQSATSQYLTRTFTSSSNNSFTLSMWVKRGILSSSYPSLFALDANNGLTFNTSDQLALYAGNATARATTTAVFRDPSAWYHIVYIRNGGQGGTTSTHTVYVNNQQVLTYTGDGGTLLSAVQHNIGWGSSTYYFDGYIAEINLVDNQVLTPSSFGAIDPTSGQWIAIPYNATYGTNGFYLNFSNGTSAATLGYDSSGFARHWTFFNGNRNVGPNDCWSIDVPSGNGFGGAQPNSNYTILNPLDNNGVTLSRANLSAAVGTVGDKAIRSSFYLTSGKWYWEVVKVADTSGTTDGNLVGVANVSQSLSAANVHSTSTNMWGISLASGNKCGNAATTAYGSAIGTGGALGIAVDVDAQKIWFRDSTGWFASGDPVAGTNPAFTNVAGTTGISPYMYKGLSTSSIEFAHNFGQRSFGFTPPTGFKSICTGNLPTATIKQGNKYMDVTLYTGNNTNQNIINAAGFQPDLVWVKSRSVAVNHIIDDSIRGAGKSLVSNSSSAEFGSLGDLIGAFNSNGFQVNTTSLGGNDASTNGPSYLLTAWQWQAGKGVSSSNTAGSTTSTVSVNTAAGFSIVSYTGTGANATIGHGLGVAPKLVLTKSRTSAQNWALWHSAFAGTQFIAFNGTSAVATDTTMWNSTVPSATVVSLGSAGNTNQNGASFIAYCFAEIAGYSKFGNYTGNASQDGPFVYCGFTPRFIIIKNTTGTARSWYIIDSARNPNNIVNLGLLADSSATEVTGTTTAPPYVDFLANGFKIRTSNATTNDNSQNHIFMAFASNPFAQSNAV